MADRRHGARGDGNSPGEAKLSARGARKESDSHGTREGPVYLERGVTEMDASVPR